MIAHLLEARELDVDRWFGLATLDLHEDLATDRLDCHVEYSGTALAELFEEKFHPGETGAEIHERVSRIHTERIGLALGPPIGFANDFALVRRRDRAAEFGIGTLSEFGAAPDLSVACGPEFLEREDGFHPLFVHHEPDPIPLAVPMELDRVYDAVHSGRVDVAVGNSTDGPIAHFDLVVLE